MPPVKTPEERGPTAWWAYRTRDVLDLSVEQVVSRLPTKTDESTLRKAEGDSRHMSRRLLRELGDLYRREFRVRGREGDYQEPPGPESRRSDVGDLPALVRAINDLVEEMRLARLAQSEWTAGVQDVLAAALESREPASPTNGLEGGHREGAQQ
jgi:hypothetical protein